MGFNLWSSGFRDVLCISGRSLGGVAPLFLEGHARIRGISSDLEPTSILLVIPFLYQVPSPYLNKELLRSCFRPQEECFSDPLWSLASLCRDLECGTWGPGQPGRDYAGLINMGAVRKEPTFGTLRPLREFG